MNRRNFGRACARVSLVTALSTSMVISTCPATPAYADLSTDLANAQEQLETLGTQYQKLEDQLSDAASELEITKSKIEETQDNLSDAQALLASNVSASYKNGSGNVLDVFMGATSFDEIVSRVFYMDKVSDAQADAIKSVQELKNKLQKQEDQQQEKIADTQKMIDETAANQKEAQQLVNSLSSEVQKQLEEEAKQNESLAAGMQSAEDGESGTLEKSSVSSSSSASSNSSSQDSSKNTSSNSSNSESESHSNSSNSSSNSNQSSSNNSSNSSNSNSSSNKPSGGSSSGNNSTGSSSIGGSALSLALSMEGVPYVFGGASPSGFDCSGLVMWAYAQLGVSLPHSASQQASYIKAHGRWTTDVSQLQYGDLVFYSGHVAFYAGNGKVFGAWRPGRGVGYGGIYDCGTPYGGGNI